MLELTLSSHCARRTSPNDWNLNQVLGAIKQLAHLTGGTFVVMLFNVDEIASAKEKIVAFGAVFTVTCFLVVSDLMLYA